ncbi:MAG TPA: tetratricopeptide repeat protein [Thermoanaerobaculia bacterium]|nr:tetratricopeptide repeat protein [Thermoanaerobaculia bacterium]
MEQDRPFFVVVVYRHESEKLEFLDAVRRGLSARGLHSRPLTPASNPDHGTGKLYRHLIDARAETIHLVLNLERDSDGRLEPTFLHYLNLHRDRINSDRLRFVLFLHESEAEPFLRLAGDLWDFRQRTFWLERPPEPRGEGLWQDLAERTARLPRSEDERREIQQHVETVRQEAGNLSNPADKAGLLLDLAHWLSRRRVDDAAASAAFEGLGLVPQDALPLSRDLELATGQALFDRGQRPEALGHLQRALAASRQLGDSSGEAVTLNNISQIYRAWGRYEEALSHLERSLELDRKLGDRSGEAVTLNNISQIYGAWGRHEVALSHLERSLELYRELGDRSGEAMTLNNIAAIYLAWGSYEEALSHLERSLELSRELGNRSGEAGTLNNISQIYDAWGRHEEALSHLERSLELCRELGNRPGEAVTLNNISQIYDGWGRYEEALSHLERSLELRRELGDRSGEAVTLNNISAIYHVWGCHEEALTHLERSLELRRELGDRSGEAVTSWNLGREYERRGEGEKAVQLLRRTVELEEELKHPKLKEHRAHLQLLEARLRDYPAPSA